MASAHDLALYLQIMMNGKDDVISAEGKALMMRPAGPASPFYGFGWFIDSDAGTVWHSGSTPGFESLATMIPARKDGVVVLVNGGSGIGFGETTQLRNGIAAAALGLDYTGEGSRSSQKALFIGLVLLPIGYLLGMTWSWRHRTAIRAKSGAFGAFSLWFPLLTTTVAAWVIVYLVPTLLGAPIATLRLFQPDLGVLLVTTSVAGVLWAVFRLGVAYTGRPAHRSPGARTTADRMVSDIDPARHRRGSGSTRKPSAGGDAAGGLGEATGGTGSGALSPRTSPRRRPHHC